MNSTLNKIMGGNSISRVLCQFVYMCVCAGNYQRTTKRPTTFYFYYFFEFFNFILFIFLYSRFLLVIYFIHISVYTSIPISQSITLPPQPLPLSPLGVHTFVLYICVSISALQTGSSVPFF